MADFIHGSVASNLNNLESYFFVFLKESLSQNANKSSNESKRQAIKFEHSKLNSSGSVNKFSLEIKNK